MMKLGFASNYSFFLPLLYIIILLKFFFLKTIKTQIRMQIQNNQKS